MICLNNVVCLASLLYLISCSNQRLQRHRGPQYSAEMVSFYRSPRAPELVPTSRLVHSRTSLPAYITARVTVGPHFSTPASRSVDSAYRPTGADCPVPSGLPPGRPASLDSPAAAAAAAQQPLDRRRRRRSGRQAAVGRADMVGHPARPLITDSVCVGGGEYSPVVTTGQMGRRGRLTAGPGRSGGDTVWW